MHRKRIRATSLSNHRHGLRRYHLARVDRRAPSATPGFTEPASSQSFEKGKSWKGVTGEDILSGPTDNTDTPSKRQSREEKERKGEERKMQCG